mgnify:CR=1 FL=1
MERYVGTISRGIRAPIIREGEDLAKIVVDSVVEAAESENFELVKMNDDGTATINMQNGTSMTVTPDSEGIASVRAASMGVSFALRYVEAIELYSFE